MEQKHTVITAAVEFLQNDHLNFYAGLHRIGVNGEWLDRGQIAAALQAQFPPAPEPQPTPFDLEAAKRGEPLITRTGKSARFIAYVKDAKVDHRVQALLADGTVCSFRENGFLSENWETQYDLFMAPKPPKAKRTVYVNMYNDGQAFCHQSESLARDAVGAGSMKQSAIAIAHRIEIPVSE